MIVGFTGTREGMTDLQKALLVNRLAGLCPDQFLHGDCIGADEEAHQLVRLHHPNCAIILHPPSYPEYRAYCEADIEMPPQGFLARNRAIAMRCDELVAAPKQTVQELRSGTWATIRYARKAGKPVHLLMP